MNISSPILLGVLRPMIVIPADIVDWTTQPSDARCCEHELAHVRTARPLRQSLSSHAAGRLLFPSASALRLPAIEPWNERWPAMIT